MYSVALDILLVARPGRLREATLAHLEREPVCRVLVGERIEARTELGRRSFDAILVQVDHSHADLDTLAELAPMASAAAILALTSDSNYQLGLAAVRLGADEHMALSRLPEGELYRAIRFAVERRKVDQVSRQALVQAHQAQKMEALGRVAAGMTHDFRNLVTIILGNCQILKRLLPPGDERLMTPVEEILLAGQKASNVVGHLLQFARNEAREATRVDLNELLLELQPLVRPLLANRIRLNLSLADRPLHVKANPTSLEQIVMNLVVNAVDALSCDGQIYLSTSAMWLQFPYLGPDLRLTHPAYAVLTVADNGWGIEPEALARIFEPFFTTKPRGTGLGLSTVFTLTREMGAELSVYSRPGLGTAFRLFLPISLVEPPLTDIKGGQVALVLDPESSERMMLRRVLEGLGLEVIEVKHACELKRMLEVKPVDLVLAELDILKEDPSAVLQAGARTILLSGLPHSILEAASANFELPVLEKPFSRHQVLQAIQERSPESSS